MLQLQGAYSHDEGCYKSFVDVINRVNIDKNFVEAYTEVRCLSFNDLQLIQIVSDSVHCMACCGSDCYLFILGKAKDGHATP